MGWPAGVIAREGAAGVEWRPAMRALLVERYDVSPGDVVGVVSPRETDWLTGHHRDWIDPYAVGHDVTFRLRGGRAVTVFLPPSCLREES